MSVQEELADLSKFPDNRQTPEELAKFQQAAAETRDSAHGGGEPAVVQQSSRTSTGQVLRLGS